ncbi:MAG: endonuclease/exonuclease/phosphatase family protein, partial [Candidatus Marinimicrobia bacterium]|nr:endonuclease/exonuclease/phosphatase family protein [Candidatus Neomarinimicrobiota bacterium]
MKAMFKTRLPLLLLMLAASACEPLVTTFEDGGEVLYYEASSPTIFDFPPDSLKVVTWNIKYGANGLDFWFDCWGERVLMTEEEVTENLDRIVAYIDVMDPDILLLNEIEISSRRSAYVDQVQYLLDHATSLNYGVYSSLWKSQFIPSDGIGRMDMGNAILSKYKLSDGKRIALALREDQDALTQYFYLRRNIVTAQVEVGTSAELYAVVVHTAAFSVGESTTKLDHINSFKDEIDRLDDAGALVIAGGDLNTIPPNAQKKGGPGDEFDGNACTDEEFQADDYTEEVNWLRALYRDYAPAIDTLIYTANESDFFTHTTKSDIPFTRKLDYLFTNIDTVWV